MAGCAGLEGEHYLVEELHIHEVEELLEQRVHQWLGHVVVLQLHQQVIQELQNVCPCTACGCGIRA